LKNKEKLPNDRLYHFANEGWQGRFFFPSLSEGKKRSLPIRGDCFTIQLGLFVRGEKITNNNNELLPCPVKPKVCRLARFLPAHGALSSK